MAEERSLAIFQQQERQSFSLTLAWDEWGHF